MQSILQGLAKISPPPPVQAPLEYDGWEVRWKMFVFRPATFKFEAIMLAVLGGYMLLHLVGKSLNMSRARNTVDPLLPLLRSQFTSVRPMQSSTSARHLVFATGRRNVLCLHMTLLLTPLHDILRLLFDVAWGIVNPTLDNSEKLIVTLTLGRGASGLQDGVGVWAVLAKDGMAKLKEERYDLSFPRMIESAPIPESHALFSEHSEITDALTKTANVGITDLLADDGARSLLKALVITDQPAEKPWKGALKPNERAREITLILHRPSTAEQESAAAAWIQVALNAADLIARGAVKPEVVRKLGKIRADVDASLDRAYNKELKEDGALPESAEEKRAARKREERKALSEAQLKKLEEKERKRDLRKMQKRNMK